MTDKPFIVGLYGQAGCGKDSVRAVLETFGFHGMAFADPIRAMLHTLLSGSGFDDKYIESRQFKESAIPGLGVSYRELAQTLGTEWGRARHPEFWLRLAGRYLAGRMEFPGHSHFVISDVRFGNEADWVRKQGGVLWRIDRPGLVPVREHVSEQEMHAFPADRVIRNDGSLSKLRSAVVCAMALAGESE